MAGCFEHGNELLDNKHALFNDTAKCEVCAALMID